MLHNYEFNKRLISLDKRLKKVENALKTPPVEADINDTQPIMPAIIESYIMKTVQLGTYENVLSSSIYSVYGIKGRWKAHQKAFSVTNSISLINFFIDEILFYEASNVRLHRWQRALETLNPLELYQEELEAQFRTKRSRQFTLSMINIARQELINLFLAINHPEVLTMPKRPDFESAMETYSIAPASTLRGYRHNLEEYATELEHIIKKLTYCCKITL